MYPALFHYLLLDQSERTPVLVMRVYCPELIDGKRDESLPPPAVHSLRWCRSAACVLYSTSSATEFNRQTMRRIGLRLLQRIDEVDVCTVLATVQPKPLAPPAWFHAILPMFACIRILGR